MSYILVTTIYNDQTPPRREVGRPEDFQGLMMRLMVKNVAEVSVEKVTREELISRGIRKTGLVE